MSVQTTALILAWVAIALLALALSGLLRQVHLLRLGQSRPQLDSGPTVGSLAPELNGDMEWPRPTVLLFADRGCSSCDRLLPVFETIAQSNTGVDFKVVFPGDANGFHSPHVETLTDQARLFAQFRIPATPYGVAVGHEGEVADASPIGSSSLLQQFVESVHERGAV
jgi:hypothetical protein